MDDLIKCPTCGIPFTPVYENNGFTMPEGPEKIELVGYRCENGCMTPDEIDEYLEKLEKEEREKEPDKAEFSVKSTKPFKLKDKPNRGGVIFDLKQTFGFIPERIIIQKIHGQHDAFIVSAVVEKKYAINRPNQDRPDAGNGSGSVADGENVKSEGGKPEGQTGKGR